MRRVVGIIRGHRIILKFGQPLRGNEMRRVIYAAASGPFVKYPVAADRDTVIVTDDLFQASGEQILDRRQTARTGANDANAAILSTAKLPLS